MLPKKRGKFYLGVVLRLDKLDAVPEPGVPVRGRADPIPAESELRRRPVRRERVVAALARNLRSSFKNRFHVSLCPVGEREASCFPISSVPLCHLQLGKIRSRLYQNQNQRVAQSENNQRKILSRESATISFGMNSSVSPP